jgi:hypothetical protein
LENRTRLGLCPKFLSGHIQVVDCTSSPGRGCCLSYSFRPIQQNGWKLLEQLVEQTINNTVAVVHERTCFLVAMYL